MHILRRDVSCGCTVASWPSTTIQPGSVDEVSFVVRAKNEAGAHSSTVTITTDDPATPRVQVRILWREHAAIRLEPRNLDLGRNDPGTSADATVEVVVAERIASQPLELLASTADLTLAWRRPKLDLETVGGYRRQKLEIQIGPSRKLGSRVAELRVGNAEVHANLLVTWKVGLPLEVTPNAFFRSDIAVNSPVEFRVMVQAGESWRGGMKGLEIDGNPTSYVSQPLKLDADGQSSMVRFQVLSGAVAGVESHVARLIFDSATTFEIPITMVVHSEKVSR